MEMVAARLFAALPFAVVLLVRPCRFAGDAAEQCACRCERRQLAKAILAMPLPRLPYAKLATTNTGELPYKPRHVTVE